MCACAWAVTYRKKTVSYVTRCVLGFFFGGGGCFLFRCWCPCGVSVSVSVCVCVSLLSLFVLVVNRTGCCGYVCVRALKLVFVWMGVCVYGCMWIRLCVCAPVRICVRVYIIYTYYTMVARVHPARYNLHTLHQPLDAASLLDSFAAVPSPTAEGAPVTPHVDTSVSHVDTSVSHVDTPVTPSCKLEPVNPAALVDAVYRMCSL